MPSYKYSQKRFFVENLSIENIAKKNITPFYLYSSSQIRDNYSSFVKSFKNINPLVCFSVKSNSNPFILKFLKKLGSGADVVSQGELLKALRAGIKPSKIVFSGVGKSEEELRIAIKKKILLINVESESEALLVNKLSKKMKRKTTIGIRLNPNIYANTHKKISTGKAEDKFGLSKNELLKLCLKISKFKNLKLIALSVHIGSQILSDNPFKKSLNVISDVIKKTKIKFKYIDLGGGFGISYKKNDKKIKLNNYSKLVYKFKKKFNCEIIFEPGRSIIGNAGILVAKVQYLKKAKNKTFAVLDAGMNDFMRPALYDAVHEIVPVIQNNKRTKSIVEFVGPVCETSCKFIKYKNYQKLSENNFVAILNVGAYGSSLSSNYNTRPLISEFLVYKNKFKTIRKRQNLLELIKV